MERNHHSSIPEFSGRMQTRIHRAHGSECSRFAEAIGDVKTFGEGSRRNDGIDASDFRLLKRQGHPREIADSTLFVYVRYNGSMSSEDLSGRVLAQYQIIKPLGAGGMGVVYLARDTRLDRTVALKILPAEIASDQERMKRFVREAKAASAIDHPNIVHVYEINEADGVNFIAMQYVEGQTLRSKLSGNPMPLNEFLRTATQVTDAMVEAHGNGVIHRDIKSANIMVSKKDQVKLLDFGLARIDAVQTENDSSQIETMSRTDPGTIAGTVAYMSPEQARGKQIDHRTDIFSMGVVFYEMATGKLPFTGNTPAETIDKIVHNQPESILRLNYNVPQEVERIIRKCLEKPPEARYQSASEILVDLKNLKRDLDSSDSKADQKLDGKRLPAVHRNYLVAVLVLLVAATIGGLLFHDWRSTNKIGNNEIRSLAVLPFKNINLNPKTEYLSDGITDSIINNVSLIKQLRVMARGTVFMYKNKEVDPRQVGKELGVDGVVTGKLLQDGNSLVVTVDLVDAHDGRQIWGEQYDRKLADIISLQSQISRQISDQLRIKLTEKETTLVAKHYTENPEAYQLYLQGQYSLMQRTPESTQKARDYFRQAIAKDPTYALAYDGLSGSYLYLGITGALLGGPPPKEVMPKAKEAALKAVQLDESLAQPHTTLANIHFNYDYDWDGTERELERALELNSNYPLTYMIRALFLSSMGRKEEAMATIQRFREVDPGYFPSILIGTGITCYWSRQYDQAIENLERITQTVPNYASPYFWLGASYLEKKDYEKAMEAFQKAVTYSHRAPVALVGLGIGYARTGKMQEAENILAELLQDSKKSYVPEFYLACLYAELGKKDEAFVWLDRGYQERANGMGLIKVFALLDKLRSDPRFSALLQRLKLGS